MCKLIAKIREKSRVSVLRTISIDCNGWNFLVVYGKGPDGWFVAIPNWQVCFEAAPPDNINYNAGKIERLMEIEGLGTVLAESIKKDWEELNHE